ncbi:MAG: hypothetical protein C5B44_01450 [Acidobacteria bacterium]|nr:MAG: hypothetical protein C5B44_01450 [Acidobacteriota bacterium]
MSAGAKAVKVWQDRLIRDDRDSAERDEQKMVERSVPFGQGGAETGKRVKKARTEKGWSQRELSEELERIGKPISIAALSRAETGLWDDFYLNQLDAIAVALGVPLSKLWTPVSKWR